MKKTGIMVQSYLQRTLLLILMMVGEPSFEIKRNSVSYADISKLRKNFIKPKTSSKIGKYLPPVNGHLKISEQEVVLEGFNIIYSHLPLSSKKRIEANSDYDEWSFFIEERTDKFLTIKGKTENLNKEKPSNFARFINKLRKEKLWPKFNDAFNESCVSFKSCKPVKTRSFQFQHRMVDGDDAKQMLGKYGTIERMIFYVVTLTYN